MITLHEGDNRDHLRRLIDEGVRVHSVVCDPPYGLTSIVKRFGADKAAPALSNGATGVFRRASGGFMGQKWDGSGIERDPEFWALIYDILLPGAYVLAFSSPRTGHWQACAMEMAGFVMHPFLGWVYGQGFPKAHNAAMAIDKQLGVKGGRGEPKSAAHAGWIERGRMRGGDDAGNNEGWQRPWMEDEDKVAAAASKYVPGSPEAAQWDGWAYGGQALKPALEPIYVGQKPFSERNGALNILKHGVGAINIDGCRVPGEPWQAHVATGLASEKFFTRGEAKEILKEPHALGRHPANLLHDGSAEVVALFPQTPGQIARSSSCSDTRKNQNCYGNMARGAPGSEMEPRNDTGSAARFFNSFPAHQTCCLCDQDIHECAVNSVDLDLPIPSTPTDGFAHSDAAGSQLLGSGSKPKASTDHATCAELSSGPTPLPNSDFAQPNAAGKLVEEIAHRASDAVPLCGSCATAFAQSLVQVSQHRDPESLLTRGCITEHRRQILIPSLALIAATPESIGTTTTTANLKMWFGFVLRAIFDTTSSAESDLSIESADPLRYCPKASKLDRAGSRHPTVKPIGLMEWCITLVTPPGGTVLDPFAGTGTTGEAARRLGFDCILMEGQPEYAADIRRRFGIAEDTFEDLLGVPIDTFEDLLG